MSDSHSSPTAPESDKKKKKPRSGKGKTKQALREDLMSLLNVAGSVSLHTARLAVATIVAKYAKGILGLIQDNLKFEGEDGYYEVGLLRSALQIYADGTKADNEFEDKLTSRIVEHSEGHQFQEILSYAAFIEVPARFFDLICTKTFSGRSEIVNIFRRAFRREVNTDSGNHGVIIEALCVNPIPEYHPTLARLLPLATDVDIRIFADSLKQKGNEAEANAWVDIGYTKIEEGSSTLEEVRLLSMLLPIGAERMTSLLSSENDSTVFFAQAILTSVRGPEQMEIIKRKIYPRFIHHQIVLSGDFPIHSQMLHEFLIDASLLEAMCSGYDTKSRFAPVFPSGISQQPNWDVKTYILDNVMPVVWKTALASLNYISHENFMGLMGCMGHICMMIHPTQNLAAAQQQSLSDAQKHVEFFTGVFMKCLHGLGLLSSAENQISQVSQIFGKLGELVKTFPGGDPTLNPRLRFAEERNSRILEGAKYATAELRMLLAQFGPAISAGLQGQGVLALSDHVEEACEILSNAGSHASYVLPALVRELCENESKACCVINAIFKIAPANAEVIALLNALIINGDKLTINSITLSGHKVDFKKPTDNDVWLLATKLLAANPSNVTSEAKVAIYQRFFAAPGKNSDLAKLLIGTGF